MGPSRKKSPKTDAPMKGPIPVHVDVGEFVKAGVAGFIPNDATLDHFLHTIRSAAKGIKVPPPPLTGSLFSQIVEHAIQIRNAKKIVKSVRMTTREQEVIDLIAQGRSNKEIAAILSIAVRTVTSHVHNIIEKLALHIRLVLTHHALASDEATESS